MFMHRCLRLAWIFVQAQLLLAAGEEVNPISRVVALLWEIKKNVELEADKEQKLFEKYECFCKKGKSNLQQNIADESMKSPQVQGDLGEAKSYLARLEEEIESSKQERTAVREKMAKAAAIRYKDAKACAQTSDDLKADIAALGKAIQALERGSNAAFLQTDAAAVLRSLVDSDRVGEAPREALQSLLGIGEDAEDAAAAMGPSSEVIGICKQLKASFEETLAQATKQEGDDVNEFALLQASSEREAKALSDAIKTKSERVAEVKARIVDIDDDAESTSESLQRDKVFVEQMQTTCATLESTYSEHKRMRGEELVTLADTIRMLGNDDTKDLFAERQGDAADDESVPSFLQMRTRARGTSKSRRQEAIRLLKAAKASQKSQPMEVNLLLLALRGKKADFSKIITMVDNMISTLVKEDKADDKKKLSCLRESEETQDSLTEAKQEIKSDSKVIADQQETQKTLKAEIVSLGEAIKRIDEAMDQSTSDRKANHEDFIQVIAENRKALAIIDQARKRLMKFYNPQVSSVDEPEENPSVKVGKKTNPNLFGPGAMGMMRGMTGFDQEDAEAEADIQARELAQQKAAENVMAEAQAQADAEAQDDEEGPRPKQPGKLGKYMKSSKASASALELLLKVKNEILRDTTEAQEEEKNHKASYQMMLANANGKRSRMVKTMMQKQMVKAKLEQDIHKLRGKKKQGLDMKADLQAYYLSLDKECGWLLKNFGARHAGRMTQKNALTQAKTILAGASR